MNENTAIQRQGAAGVVARDGMGGQEIEYVAETAAAAVAAQARAAVEARYVLALRRPRDWDDVRVRLLKECARPAFAAQARYAKPVGGSKVEGPSVRFAEAALRCMGNVMPEVQIVYDDERKRIVRVGVTDLEANLTYTTDVMVEKTVERSKLQPGQKKISSRTNSYGKEVFLVAATEDDLINKQASLVSKSIRQSGLRILPGDIKDECMRRVMEVIASGDAKDPDAARKQIADAFAGLGVSPAHLREYLGHDIGTCSPAELVDLRAVWAAINDGETTWSAVMEGAGREPEKMAPPPAPPPAPVKPDAARERRAGAPTRPVRPAAPQAENSKPNSPEDIGFRSGPGAGEPAATAPPPPAPPAPGPTSTETDSHGRPLPPAPADPLTTDADGVVLVDTIVAQLEAATNLAEMRAPQPAMKPLRADETTYVMAFVVEASLRLLASGPEEEIDAQFALLGGLRKKNQITAEDMAQAERIYKERRAAQ